MRGTCLQLTTTPRGESACDAPITEPARRVEQQETVSLSAAALLTARAGLPFSPRHDRERLDVKHRLGQERLELGVLGLKPPQPPSVRHVHPAKAAALLLGGRIAEPVLAPELLDSCSGLHLLQEPYDLLVSECRLLHARSLLRKSDFTHLSVALKTGVRSARQIALHSQKCFR